MFDNVEMIRWPDVVRPLSTASMALGRLAHGLETTPLHATWLWREITRVAVTIAQAGGYRAKVDHLRLALIGAPIEREDNTTGLAAAKRVFLASAPRFRTIGQADSDSVLWPEFWTSHQPDGENDELTPAAGNGPSGDGGLLDEAQGSGRAGESDGSTEEMHERDRLLVLVRELAAFADDGHRPALINLFIDLRKHAGTRHLPPGLARIALPLALVEAGLVPKAVPGLLGGRRLPLGFSHSVAAEKPLTDWLKQALDELAVEADQSYRRLIELISQHQAWHAVLAKERLRRHALAPRALDLLAATPVLNIGLVASHLDCSHVAAGKVVERLVDLGILIEQTSRARHKVFIAGDLPRPTPGDEDMDHTLVASAPLKPVDVDALNATLEGVFADLDRKNQLSAARLTEAKG